MAEQGTSFHHLDGDVLGIVFRNLQPRDIAVLSCASKELNTYTRSLSIWEELVRAAWRCEGAASAPCLANYNGDWKAMYCSRMALPRSFLLACDVVGATTASIRDASAETEGRLPNILLSDAFDRVARALVSISTQLKGTAAGSPVSSKAPPIVSKASAATSKAPTVSSKAAQAVQRSRELALCKQDVAWWMQEAPHVVMGFARRAREQARLASPSGSCSCASDVQWQRKALAFCLDLALNLREVHPSVGYRLERELQELDASAVLASKKGMGALAMMGEQ